jgi:8-oxo-dGTP pyrophosphatase MutT (NUDIX family)
MTWYPHKTVAVVVELLPVEGVDPPQKTADLQRRFLMVEEIVNGQHVYNQPAGHLEPGETLVQGAIRETLEETAWHVEPIAFLGLYQYISPENNESYIRSCFVAKALHFDAQRTLDKDIVATHWMTLSDVSARRAHLRSPVVMQVLHDFCNGQQFPLSVIRTL